MAELFANERKNIRFESRQIGLFLLSWGLRPTFAKTAFKAENNGEEVPMNTTVSKSGPNTQKHQSNKRPESKKF